MNLVQQPYQPGVTLALPADALAEIERVLSEHGLTDAVLQKAGAIVPGADAFEWRRRMAFLLVVTIGPAQGFPSTWVMDYRPLTRLSDHELQHALNRASGGRFRTALAATAGWLAETPSAARLWITIPAMQGEFQELPRTLRAEPAVMP